MNHLFVYNFSGNGSWVPPPYMEKPMDLEKRNKSKNVWLFNIQDDPNEKNDLSEKRTDIVAKMLDRLSYYQNTAVPCYYPPNDPRSNPAELGGYWGPWEWYPSVWNIDTEAIAVFLWVTILFHLYSFYSAYSCIAKLHNYLFRCSKKVSSLFSWSFWEF